MTGLGKLGKRGKLGREILFKKPRMVFERWSYGMQWHMEYNVWQVDNNLVLINANFLRRDLHFLYESSRDTMNPSTQCDNYQHRSDQSTMRRRNVTCSGTLKPQHCLYHVAPLSYFTRSHNSSGAVTQRYTG